MGEVGHDLGSYRTLLASLSCALPRWRCQPWQQTQLITRGQRGEHSAGHSASSMRRRWHSSCWVGTARGCVGTARRAAPGTSVRERCCRTASASQAPPARTAPSSPTLSALRRTTLAGHAYTWRAAAVRGALAAGVCEPLRCRVHRVDVMCVRCVDLGVRVPCLQTVTRCQVLLGPGLGGVSACCARPDRRKPGQGSVRCVAVDLRWCWCFTRARSAGAAVDGTQRPLHTHR